MARVFLGMGSNLGNGLRNLLLAWRELGAEPGISCVTLSSPYVTAPVDMQSQHWFTNCVGELATELTPHQLLECLMAIEKRLGRVREEHVFGYQDRVIDIDILFYDDLQLDDPELILPHPHFQDRLFVLSPFSEIAPDFIDCRSGRTVGDLEEGLRTRLEDRRIRSQDISRTQWPDSGGDIG